VKALANLREGIATETARGQVVSGLTPEEIKAAECLAEIDALIGQGKLEEALELMKLRLAELRAENAAMERGLAAKRRKLERFLANWDNHGEPN
jgi:hypothetical protein